MTTKKLTNEQHIKVVFIDEKAKQFSECVSHYIPIARLRGSLGSLFVTTEVGRFVLSANRRRHGHPEMSLSEAVFKITRNE
jgi:hypothetical protein